MERKTKKSYIIFALSVAFALATIFLSLAFSGCGESRFFITLMDGTTVVDSLLTNTDGVVDLGEREKNGYIFDGWYFDENLNRKYNGDRFWGDTILYCGWTSLEYTVTFALGGGEFAEDGTDASAPQTPQDPESSVVRTPKLDESGNYTLTVLSGEELHIALPTREHYDFAGWSCRGALVVDGDAFEYAANVTFYAQWSAHHSRISYNADGGTIYNASGVAVGGSATQYAYYDSPFTPYTVVKAGYNFTGWFDADGVKLDAIGSWQTENNYSVTAHYTPIVYSITFELTSGRISQDVTFGTNYDFTKRENVPNGYVFDCWEYTLDGVAGTLNSSGSWSIPSNVTLTPRYAARNFNLTLVSDGVQFAYLTVPFGSDVALPDPPTKNGFTFAGWFANDSGTGDRLLDGDYWGWNEDKTFYARFISPSAAISFRIEYYLEKTDYESGASDADKYELSEASFSAVGIAGDNVIVNVTGFDNKFEYYDFDEADSRNATRSLTLVSGSTATLRFYFNRETVDYSFVDSTDRTYTMHYRVGQTVDLSSIAEKRGYELIGWMDAQSHTIPADSTSYKAASVNTVLTAVWQIKTYAVYIDDNFAFNVDFNATLTAEQKDALLLDDTDDDIFDGYLMDATPVPKLTVESMTIWDLDIRTKSDSGVYEIRLTSSWQARRAYYAVELWLENESGVFVRSESASFFKNDEINKAINYDVNVVELTVDGVNYAFDSANTNNITSIIVLADNSAVVKLCYKRS